MGWGGAQLLWWEGGVSHEPSPTALPDREGRTHSRAAPSCCAALCCAVLCRMQQHALDTFKRVGVAVRMGVRVVEVRRVCVQCRVLCLQMQRVCANMSSTARP